MQSHHPNVAIDNDDDETESTRALETKFAALERDLAIYKLITDDRIRELAEEVERQNALISRLTQTPAIAGTFPPLDQIEKLVVQVFWSSVEITRQRQRTGTTPWSLRIEYWQHGHKQKPIDVKMVKANAFLLNLKKAAAPRDMLAFAEHVAGTDALCGIVRRKTQGQGSPYVPTQTLVLLGHTDHRVEDVAVQVNIGEAMAAITAFRLAAGSKLGHALWVGSWMNK